jgi:hypothetical protein
VALSRRVAAGLIPLLGIAAAGVVLTPVVAEARSMRPILRWPGPGPQVRGTDLSPQRLIEWNAGCEHCHEAVASEWRSSRHHAAYENESFQAAVAREPEITRSFCVHCHAPESRARVGVDAASELGVACVTCHVPLGPVLAAGRDPARQAPHATLGSVDFRSADACRGCHEFAFPKHRAADTLMQRTVSEHEESGRDIGCSACHMPAEGGHRSHAFRGGYDEPFVRSSVVVSAELGSGEAHLSLETKDVTHAVPTGDLFRRLAVEVVPIGGGEVRLPALTRYLARHYEVRGGERREIGDDRLHLGPRHVSFALPPEALGFEWRVRYERVGFHPGEREDGAAVESAFDVASGVVRR